MNKNTKITLAVIVVLVIGLAVLWPSISPTSSASKYPTKDITLVVPWNAGGSSDLIGRLLVAEMKKKLGVNVQVVNTPGATGTVGMNDVINAKHDGYSLIGNATPYNHYIMGLAPWKPADWDFMGAYYCPGIIAVSKKQPYKTFNDLLADIKAKPGAISGGTAGVGSSGFTNMEILKSVVPELGNYKHVAYTGGAAAVTATLSGEVVFTPQLANEMIDLLRSGDLIALAALTPDDLKIEGVSYTIPSIKNFLPQTEKILPCGDAFGLMFPADVPKEVKDKLEAAYLEACKSDAAKKFANEKGVILKAMNIKDSNALRDKTASVVGWALFNAKVAPKSPADIGIPKP